MNETNSAVIFGELLWDNLPEGSRLGGAPANFAYRLASLGVPAKLVSCLGADAPGENALRILQAAGLDCSLVQTNESLETGYVSAYAQPDHQMKYMIHENVAYDAIQATPGLLEAGKSAPLLYFGTLVQRAGISRETLRKLFAVCTDALKVVDVNLRPNTWTPETLRWSIEHADVLKISEEEISDVAAVAGAGSSDERALADVIFDEFSASYFVVTYGDRGAYAFSREHGSARHPGFQVTVADTVGAGDSFFARFVYGLTQGESLLYNLEQSCKVGALACVKSGGMASITAMEYAAALPSRPIHVSERDGSKEKMNG